MARIAAGISESGHSVTAVSHPHTRAAALPSWLIRGGAQR